MSRSQSPPANTLLEGTASREDVHSEVCDELVRPDETDLLVLTYRDDPNAWLRTWKAHVGDARGEVGMVHVGGRTRSAAATSGAAASRPTPTGLPSPVRTVPDPTDLARIGIYASEYLESWSDDGRRSVVYLDSLTELLDHADLEPAFQFLHVLSGRIESVDARGFFLVDPSARDDRSLAVVRELADAVVDLDAARS